MICVLIDCPESLAFCVPLPAPVRHMLYLRSLGADNVLREVLDRWDLALLVGYLGHPDSRLVVRDHGVYERLVEGLLIGEFLRVHHHAHALHLLLAHLHRHLRGPKLFLLYGLELLDLGLLARDVVVGELLYLLVLGVLEGYSGHLYGTLVMGNHSINESLSEYLPFSITICRAMPMEPIPIGPWPIWPWSIEPWSICSCPPPPDWSPC